MIIQCSHCAARYKVDPSKAKKPVLSIKCPKCAAVFQITLAPSTELPASEASPAPSPARTKVLIVDDSHFFLELILDVLKPLSLEILTAGDGEEALALIRRERPTLVLLDLNLPKKNGYQLIRDVRADVSLKKTRLLAMSGVFRQEADVARVEMAGADGFINKSFTPEQLQQRVTSLLEG